MSREFTIVRSFSDSIRPENGCTSVTVRASKAGSTRVTVTYKQGDINLAATGTISAYDPLKASLLIVCLCHDRPPLRWCASPTTPLMMWPSVWPLLAVDRSSHLKVVRDRGSWIHPNTMPIVSSFNFCGCSVVTMFRISPVNKNGDTSVSFRPIESGGTRTFV